MTTDSFTTTYFTVKGSTNLISLNSQYILNTFLHIQITLDSAYSTTHLIMARCSSQANE